MKEVVDARGLACPQPVVLTRKAIAAADHVTTIVDNTVAVENVTRFARSKGFSVEVSEKADGSYLTLRREGAGAEREGTPRTPPLPRGEQKGVQPAVSATVLFISSDCIGRGSAELGERLMGAFFQVLPELESRPTKIILMNSGVKLAVEGSPTLEDLRALAEQGVEILACGTCLNYFDLTKKLAVGRVSNMYEIAKSLLEAGRIVDL
jgi:selenium metabolism protein YedF